MNFKKILPIVLTVFALTACGKSKDPDVPGNTEYPENNKVYKLGFENENLGSTFYFTGEMDGYYGATTTDCNSGIHVITEKSGDGWKLTFEKNGTQNVGVALSGNHTNFVFGTDITTIWTYDADYNTFLTTISGTQYWLGSLGSKSYTTISAYRVDDKFATDFHCHLYESDGVTGGNGGSTGGESGNELEEVIATYAEAIDADYYYDDVYGDYYFEVIYEPTVSFLDAVTDVLNAKPSEFTVLNEPFEDYWDEAQTDPGAFAYVGTLYTGVIIELGAYYYADEDIVIVQGVSFYEE
jgi:hypothetical protein